MKHKLFLAILLIIATGCTSSYTKRNVICSADVNRHDSCTYIVDNNLAVLLKADKYLLPDHLISKEVSVKTLINCCLEADNIKNQDVRRALIKYCELYIEAANQNNFNPALYSNDGLIGKILGRIKDKDGFELHLKLLSFNQSHNWGHGNETCESTGVQYFQTKIIPNIKNINGQNVKEWYKDFEFENYLINYTDDCGLKYYNLLYAFIKKAWEEGKIELNAP